MTVNAYSAKAALITLLKANTDTGEALDGVDVAYSWGALTASNRCVYGGWVSFAQTPSVPEYPGLLVSEDATINLYIRATDNPPTDVETTDAAVAGIVAAVGTVLRANPKLGGGYSWTGITSGNGDYSETDTETTSVMVLRVGVSTQLSYGV